MKNLLQILIFLLVSTGCGMSEEEKQRAQDENETMVNEKIEAFLEKQKPTLQEADKAVDSTQIDSAMQAKSNLGSSDH